jgi:restriction system protein
MEIPTYDQFIEPMMRFLCQYPEGILAKEVHEAVAEKLNLTDAQRAQRLPSGVQPVYKNRAGWAHDRLKRAGLSSSPRRGYWMLTTEGRALIQGHPQPFSAEEIKQLATGHLHVHLRSLPGEPDGVDDQSVDELSLSQSPDDRLDSAVSELRSSVASELLQTLASVKPATFELIVLDLLHRMGYGASHRDLQRVGGPGDGGIDGIISLDQLGFEKVYVQAKRWQANVGSPELQAFYGALAGQRARKGVFITTSSFTPNAINFAHSVEGIVLIDGRRLAELMIDHEVGVTMRAVRIPEFDSDYFDE